MAQRACAGAQAYTQTLTAVRQRVYVASRYRNAPKSDQFTMQFPLFLHGFPVVAPLAQALQIGGIREQ